MVQPLTPKELRLFTVGFFARMTPFWLILIIGICYADVVKIVNPIFLLPILVILAIVQLLLFISYAKKQL